MSYRSFSTIAACWLLAASNAQAGTQLFEGSWVIKAFGNERTGGTGESEFYSAYRLPLGVQCNSRNPRCPYESTPTDGAGNFAPLGGSRDQALYCAPWYDWHGRGTTMRPTSYEFYNLGFNTVPPLPRNLAFFTPSGNPNATHCGPRSTSLGGYGSLGGGPGVVQAGRPITGSVLAATTGTAMGGFSFPAAPFRGASGISATGVVGEFDAVYPYVYAYTYATLRNATGSFGPGKGLGDAYLRFPREGSDAPNAQIQIRQGAHKFGGVMRMLGVLASKVCFYRGGGCSRGKNNWLFEAAGTTGNYRSTGGKITQGYQALTTAVYFNSGLAAYTSVPVVGSRFGWTTGSVTVTAVGRGPHKTVHYAHGYDNRATTSMGAQTGTIQLVTPLLTQWLRPGASFETGGIGILKLRFVPEPRGRWVLVAGAGALILFYGLRLRNAAPQRPSHLD